MSSNFSRRHVLRTGLTTALVSTLPRTALFGQRSLTGDAARLDDLVHHVASDDMRTLALRAVDAARAAGAVYADVRLTRTVTQKIQSGDKGGWEGTSLVRADFQDEEVLGFGVRALVNGYWGFVASPYWGPDEATRLAKDAVSQAQTNALGSPRVVEWTPLPAATGAWISPGLDPFSIPIEEKVEFLNGWRQAVVEAYDATHRLVPKTTRVELSRQEWYMASTEGTAISQTLLSTNGTFPFSVASRVLKTTQRDSGVSVEAAGFSKQQGGWEILVDARVRDQIPGLIESVVRDRTLTSRPADIGRYDVVLDARTTGALVGSTFGPATQLDRAMGFESNAGGTSYLGPDPMACLGTSLVASPLVHLSANRSMPKGNATVKWDDEGVLSEEFSIVKDGLLVDYQTTREQASWLKPWYAKTQQSVRSRGCAVAASALYTPLQQTPNLVLQPGRTASSFESLVAGVKKGYAIMKGHVYMDMQVKNGTGGGYVREINNGKLGDIIVGAAFLFNTTEFWKNVTALGDASTVKQVSQSGFKGQPGQTSHFSVAAVPMAVKNVSIVEWGRRA